MADLNRVIRIGGNAQRMRQRLEAARTRVSAAEERAVRYLRKTMTLGHRDAGAFSDCHIGGCINWRRGRAASTCPRRI